MQMNWCICFIPYYVLAANDPTLFDMVENCEDVKEELKEIENQKKEAEVSPVDQSPDEVEDSKH